MMNEGPQERDRNIRWTWTEDQSQVFLVDGQGGDQRGDYICSSVR